MQLNLKFSSVSSRSSGIMAILVIAWTSCLSVRAGKQRMLPKILLIRILTGAWHGQGRKAGWWSPILLAVYDPDTETFQALCKVGVQNCVPG